MRALQHWTSDRISRPPVCKLASLAEPVPHPSPPGGSGGNAPSAVQWLTCVCTAVVQSYTAVTDSRNSDAYAYAINFEYLMATVRSPSPCIQPATQSNIDDVATASCCDMNTLLVCRLCTPEALCSCCMFVLLHA